MCVPPWQDIYILFLLDKTVVLDLKSNYLKGRNWFGFWPQKRGLSIILGLYMYRSAYSALSKATIVTVKFFGQSKA